MSKETSRLSFFAAAFVSVSVAICLFNFFVDPLQVFGPATLHRPYYLADPRIQGAGLIRSQRFDTIFIGSSLGMRYRKSDIDRIFGVKSVKLAMSGPSSAELNLVIACAMVRRPRKIIWQMDDWMFRDGPDIDTSPYFPADLYRMNIKGIAGYLFNPETTRESFGTLLRQNKITTPIALNLIWMNYLKLYYDDVNEINTFPSGVDLSTIFNSQAALDAYNGYRDPTTRAELAKGYDYDAIVRNFERDALSLIENNPEAEFIIYFPPYSILQFVALRDFAPNVLHTIYRFNVYALTRLSMMSNVTLFDFRDVEPITHNLDNYMDTVHHSPAIDIRVMEEIRDGLHRVDRNAPTRSIELLQRQVDNYVVPQ